MAAPPWCWPASRRRGSITARACGSRPPTGSSSRPARSTWTRARAHPATRGWRSRRRRASFATSVPSTKCGSKARMCGCGCARAASSGARMPAESRTAVPESSSRSPPTARSAAPMRPASARPGTGSHPRRQRSISRAVRSRSFSSGPAGNSAARSSSQRQQSPRRRLPSSCTGRSTGWRRFRRSMPCSRRRACAARSRATAS
jgi:hypothetical protein